MALAQDDESGVWRCVVSGDAVNARWFGARPDSSRNQWKALQASIDAASRITGRLFIPQGTYGVAGKLTLLSGLTLEGAGMGTTTLRVLPGASGLERTLRAFGSPDRYVTNITIPDLTVDGNRSILTKIGSEEESHSTIYLIFVDDVLLERVEATNAQGAGFRIGSLQNSNPARNVTLRDCRATGNFQNGVAPTLVDNFLMEGCYVADTELVVSVDFETHDSMDVKKNCTVRDCTFTGVKQPILVRDIRGCRTVNNTILRTEASGDTVPAITVVPNDEPTSGVVIANNDIRDLTATQPAAIYTGNSNGASVTGNPIIGGKVGIRLLSASTDTFVSGNSIRNMDEHGIAGKFDLPYSRIVDNAIVDDRSPSRLKNGIYHSENNQAFPVVVSRNVIRGAQTAINLDDSSAKQGDPWIVSENLID